MFNYSHQSSNFSFCHVSDYCSLLSCDLCSILIFLLPNHETYIYMHQLNTYIIMNQMYILIIGDVIIDMKPLASNVHGYRYPKHQQAITRWGTKGPELENNSQIDNLNSKSKQSNNKRNNLVENSCMFVFKKIRMDYSCWEHHVPWIEKGTRLNEGYASNRISLDVSVSFVKKHAITDSCQVVRIIIY